MNPTVEVLEKRFAALALASRLDGHYLLAVNHCRSGRQHRIRLAHYTAALESEQELSVSISCIDKFLGHKLGYRYKKRSSPVNSSAKMSLEPASNGKL
jgi:transposase